MLVGERLWSFFASYVVVLSGSSQLNLMVDQYYLWRAGRAVSVALWIAFLELQILVVIPGLVGTHRLDKAFLLDFLLLGFLLPLGMNVLTMLITLGTYSRLSFTLFALVYVTQDKLNVQLNSVPGLSGCGKRGGSALRCSLRSTSRGRERTNAPGRMREP